MDIIPYLLSHSIPLPTKLLADQLYLQIYPPETVDF